MTSPRALGSVVRRRPEHRLPPAHRAQPIYRAPDYFSGQTRKDPCFRQTDFLEFKVLTSCSACRVRQGRDLGARMATFLHCDFAPQRIPPQRRRSAFGARSASVSGRDNPCVVFAPRTPLGGSDGRPFSAWPCAGQRHPQFPLREQRLPQIRFRAPSWAAPAVCGRTSDDRSPPGVSSHPNLLHGPRCDRRRAPHRTGGSHGRAQ